MLRKKVLISCLSLLFVASCVLSGNVNAFDQVSAVVNNEALTHQSQVICVNKSMQKLTLRMTNYSWGGQVAYQIHRSDDDNPDQLIEYGQIPSEQYLFTKEIAIKESGRYYVTLSFKPIPLRTATRFMWPEVTCDATAVLFVQ